MKDENHHEIYERRAEVGLENYSDTEWKVKLIFLIDKEESTVELWYLEYNGYVEVIWKSQTLIF